ncbi:hypothetical protein MLD38_028575 [Melastoma candidum]|uniref:Uncharacterized protein n=1 Tax=Melastoma candidum TaxID=119954 RepID=A0ACB9N7A3_9MYRT|nr:hypothetical protein MLD38_028575 [Melastoma candidum]
MIQAGVDHTGVTTEMPVPLPLTLLVSSQGYVVGKLAKTTFQVRVACNITMDPENIIVTTPLTQNIKHGRKTVAGTSPSYCLILCISLLPKTAVQLLGDCHHKTNFIAPLQFILA